MNIMRRNMLLGGAAMLPLGSLMLTKAWAQTASNAPGAAPGEDPLLAACLLMKGRRQIECCRLAQQRSQNEEVKAFLKAEIEEHETIKTNLKKMNFESPAVARGGNQPAVAAQPMVTVGAVMIPPPASQMLIVDGEVVDQCIANYRKMLEKKQGIKLEKAIIGDQYHEHMALLDHAQVFSKHASQAMQPLLAEGLKIIQNHLATCEQLMIKLDQMKQDQ